MAEKFILPVLIGGISGYKQDYKTFFSIVVSDRLHTRCTDERYFGLAKACALEIDQSSGSGSCPLSSSCKKVRIRNWGIELLCQQ